MKNKNEFEELENSLYNLYSSDEGVKKEVYAKMTNKKPRRKYAAVIALIAVIGIGGIAGASGIFRDVLKFRSDSGRINIIETERVDGSTGPLVHQLEPELRGLIFDKDGNELSELVEDESIYNKDDEEIVAINTTYNEEEDKIEYEILTEKEKKDRDEQYKIEEPVGEIIEVITFKPFTLPEEKYEYKYSQNFAEDKSKPSDILNLYYELDGKEIKLLERKSTDENDFALGGDVEVEEINYNGIKMAVVNNDSLLYEKDGVLMHIIAKGFTRDELFTIYDDLQN